MHSNVPRAATCQPVLDEYRGWW